MSKGDGQYLRFIRSFIIGDIEQFKEIYNNNNRIIFEFVRDEVIEETINGTINETIDKKIMMCDYTPGYNGGYNDNYRDYIRSFVYEKNSMRVWKYLCYFVLQNRLQNKHDVCLLYTSPSPRD